MEVIVKTTTSCNGTCAYCSASSPGAAGASLAADRLPELFHAFEPWLRDSPRRTLRFTWHGGEPLSCGPDYYRRVVAEQRTIFGADVRRVRNEMQSNLTLLDERWLPVLRDLVGDRPIGTSYDIVPGVRGIRGRASYAERWLGALRLLGGAGIKTGLIYVVHRRALGRARDLYHFFRNLDPRLSVRFNPLYFEGRAREDASRELRISPAEYGEFLLELLDAWLEDGRRGNVPPVSEWYRALRDPRERLCCDSSGACTASHLGVDPDGTAFLCGRASDAGVHPLGNVLRDPLPGILAHDVRRALAARSATLRRGECAGCEYWRLCRGGCPVIAWQYFQDYQRRSYFCESRRMVYARLVALLGLPAPGSAEA